jgi:hypothetical protein
VNGLNELLLVYHLSLNIACIIVVTGVECSEVVLSQRWSHFLGQSAKVDSTMQRTIHHEDAETVFG